MKVTLLASTQFWGFPDSVEGTPYRDRTHRDYLDAVRDADTLAEFAGRSCYQSWSLPNKATAENAGYLANIIRQGHFSVLEHSSATFYVEGVSRALTHELVRHRHLSYSELSQRFVDVSEARFVVPPALREMSEPGSPALGEPTVGDVLPEAIEQYEEIVEHLTEKGFPRKRAREAARALMPNGTETKIVVTGNLRAWRDFLGKRWHVAADAEIRELAGEILKVLRDVAPASVQDVPEEPYGTEAA